MTKKGNEGFEDLHAHMEQIQKNRTHRKAASETSQPSKETLEQVKTVIKSVVKAFIEGDRSLFLQSTDFDSFFVSCGYSHVTRIWITSATEERVAIMMQSDFNTQMIYSGQLEKEEIEKAVKKALLTWYTSIFST